MNGDRKIDQEIFANDVFYLRGRRPSKVLLEVSCFVRSFNLLFSEELLIYGDRTKKGSV